MFYISETYNFIRKNIVKTMVLSFFSVVLLFGFCNFSYFQNEISKRLPTVDNQHYFNALVDHKINVFSIKRKIEELPGVTKFEVLGEEVTKLYLEDLNTSLNLSEEELVELSSMITIKVSMTPELNESSISLIREYMNRLAGSQNIMLGGVKKKINNEVVFKNLISIIKKWPLQIALSVLVAFWMVSFISIRNEIKKVSFIIENFQRKSNVAMKMTLSLTVVNLILGLVLSYLMFEPNFYSVLLFCAISMFVPFAFGKRSQWVKA